jgi:hypothetical protein
VSRAKSASDDPRLQDSEGRRRRALEAFAKHHNITSFAEWARNAGLPNANSLYNYLSGRSSFLAPQTLERLRAAVPGATLHEMLGEAPNRYANIRTLPVRTEARSGSWHDSYEMLDRDEPEVAVPDLPGVHVDELVRLGDDHADDIYRTGAFICVEHLSSMGRRLVAGERVLLTRKRGGRVEVTVRELATEDGRMVLSMRSPNPEHGTLIRVPTPYDGQVWKVDGDALQIRGRISAAFVPEPARAA